MLRRSNSRESTPPRSDTGENKEKDEEAARRSQARRSRGAEITPRLKQLSDRHKEINPDRPDTARQKVQRWLKPGYSPKTARVRAAHQQIQDGGKAIAK